MKIGSNVEFSFKNRQGVLQKIVLTLSTDTLDIYEMSDDEVVQRLAAHLQQKPITTLVQMGCILAARNLLRLYPDAYDIYMKEIPKQQQQKDNSAAGGIIILAVLAVIVAILSFPLLIMLGMRKKLFLKGFYENCKGDEYEKFVKNYTFIGIGLYALTFILFAVDKIFELYVLSGPAFGILFVGGVAYFVVSLLLIKNKFNVENNPKDFIKTIKNAFKKAEK